jgi:hypothetical protein
MENPENDEADNGGESTFVESGTHPTLPAVRCSAADDRESEGATKRPGDCGYKKYFVALGGYL